MLFSRKFFVLTGCVVAVCGSLLAANDPAKKEKDKEKDKAKAAQTAKPDKKADGKKPDARKSAEKASGDDKQPPKLVIPLPKGEDSKGVTIPIPDPAGKKIFKIGVGTRVDDNLVKMKDLLIETYNPAGAQEITIALPSSMLDLSTRVITGDQGVTINRSDFQITGKNMEFNTETRNGWIKGDVKMIIYDLSLEAPATPGTKAASPNQKPSGS